MVISTQRLSGFSTCVAFISVRLILASAQTLKDSCVVVGPEIPDFHTPGEAVIIRFPFLEDAIRYRRLRLDNSSSFHVNHTSLSNQSSLRLHRDRVKLSGRGVLLLPGQTTDSGTYSYTLRSDTFCLTGSISITVSADLNTTVMPFSTYAGADTRIICPHLQYYTRTQNARWHKNFESRALPVGRGRYSIEKGIILAIRNISVEDEGYYTCRLTVVVNNAQYNVSRTWRVHVTENAAPPTVTSNRPPVTSSAVTSSGISSPHFVSPVNGSFIESRSGSQLLLQCVVSAVNPSSAELTWLINGNTPEHSHLAGRALQSQNRITDLTLEVQLLISILHEEDHGTELSCRWRNQEQKLEVLTYIRLTDSGSWWSVAAVISCCFLLVLAVFSCQLCRKNEKRGDYFLARQNSSVLRSVQHNFSHA